MEKCTPLHLDVEAIEKEAFVSSSAKVTNFTYYMYTVFTL